MNDTTRRRICPHGDDTCPCTDGDACHYATLRMTDGGDWEVSEAMPCPISGVVGCTARGDEAIHVHFELSYASWLVLPRAALQSMPADWQHRFVALIGQLAAAAYEADVVIEPKYGYEVRARREDTADYRLVTDLSRYDRGRRRLW